jgi:photosystem II stability/assembly factor-like uncharacterized protein
LPAAVVTREASARTAPARDALEAAPTITTGSSPDPRICWLVGPGGVVLRSTDGRTFIQIAFPEPVDLLGVRAADAQRATVVTADGRTFGTEDGGGSWTRR